MDGLVPDTAGSDPGAGLAAVVLLYGAAADASALASDMLANGVDPAAVMLVHNPDRAGGGPAGQPPGTRLLRMPANRGYAGGMNAGIREALELSPDVVLLVTQDVRLEAGLVDALRDAMRADPRLGAAGPSLCDPVSGRPFSHGFRALRGGGLAHRRATPLPDLKRVPVAAIDGAVMMLRCDALREVGLFEERFFMYFEEAELALRLRRRGWHVAVVPSAVASQESGATRRPSAFGYLMARNGLEYARRAAGARGVAMTLARQTAETALTMRDAVVARDAAMAKTQALRLVGVAAGVAAFLIRRWGPPPSFLAGDISGVSPGDEISSEPGSGGEPAREIAQR